MKKYITEHYIKPNRAFNSYNWAGYISNLIVSSLIMIITILFELHIIITIIKSYSYNNINILNLSFSFIINSFFNCFLFLCGYYIFDYNQKQFNKVTSKEFQKKYNTKKYNYNNKEYTLIQLKILAEDDYKIYLSPEDLLNKIETLNIPIDEILKQKR